MKIVFNKRLVDGPYGGGNQILRLLKGYFESKGLITSFSLDEDTTVIVLMDVRDGGCIFPLRDVTEFKRSHPNVKIICRINENDAHRIGSNYLDALIINSSKIADKIVFVSEWLRGYFRDRGMNVEGSITIPNGANRKLFHSANNKRLPNEPLRIVTHHVSNNILKGYECYREIDKYCHRNPSIANFTFIGRPMEGFINFSRVIPPVSYFELPSLLQSNHLYVTASMFEPGPNHVVEGMSCGLIPLVYSKATSCLECSCGFHISFNNNEDLFEKINKLYNDYSYYNDLRNNMGVYTYGSDEMCEKYYGIIREICAVNFPEGT